MTLSIAIAHHGPPFSFMGKYDLKPGWGDTFPHYLDLIFEERGYVLLVKHKPLQSRHSKVDTSLKQTLFPGTARLFPPEFTYVLSRQKKILTRISIINILLFFFFLLI